MAIIRGTTPIIEFAFSDIQIADITAANLYVKQDGRIKIAKDIDSAIVSTSLSWRLTQEETLALAPKQAAQIVCDWKLQDGTRGRSNVLTVDVGEPGKAEVM